MTVSGSGGTGAPGTVNQNAAPSSADRSASHRAAVPLGGLADDRQAEAGAGHRAGLRRSGRSGRRRAAGRSAAMPGPSSSTVSVAVGERHRDGAAGGLHLAALSSRLVTARSRARGSPTTHHGRRATSKRTSGRAAADPLDGAVDDLGEVDGSTARRQRLVAGQLDQVADQVVSSSIWARTSSSSSARCLGGRPPALVGLGEQVEVGAQRGQRRAQLVAGVGDQLALPVPGGGERGEHRVERRGEPGDLVVALDRRSGCSSSVRAMCSAAAVSRRTGRRPLRATPQPASAGGDHAGAARTAASPARAGRSACSLRLQRLGEDQRAARPRRGHGDDPVVAVAGLIGADATWSRWPRRHGELGRAERRMRPASGRRSACRRGRRRR